MAVQTPSSAKNANTRMVLDLIAKGNGVSRTQIAESTELSPASVTRIVNTLIALRLVREEGSAKSAGRGRKARFLTTCEDGLYTVGVCIEPGVVLLCISDLHRRIVFRAGRALDPRSPHPPHALAAVAGELLAQAGPDVVPDRSRLRAAGVSVAGLVDNRRGVVLHSDQLNWQNADLRAAFEGALRLPVWIENDAKACLVGERARRMSPREEEIAYLLIGTGIGVAGTCAGRVIRGCGNEAGEVEHLNLLPSFTNSDTLQAHLIEEYILRSARAASPQIETLDDLAAAHRQGLFFARLLVEDFERYLRLVLSMIFCFYDPETVILGGPTILKLAPLLPALFEDGRLALGDDYETACLLGASIGAESYALELLLGA